MSKDVTSPSPFSDGRHSEKLQQHIAQALAEDVICCGEPVLIAKGIENRNYAITVQCVTHERQLILRCPPVVIPEWRTDEGLYDLEREYHILHELTYFDIPTPRVWGYDPGDLFGVPCFLMERLPGDSMPWHLTPAYGDDLIQEYAHAISSICQVDYASRPQLARLLPVWSMQHSLAWYTWRSRPHCHDPLVAYALGWLKERQPPSRPFVLCHSDVNPGNFLVQNHHITGIIDWEFACVRDDPLNDLTCVSWLFERVELQEVFCHALGRDISEFAWFAICAHFGNAYTGNPSQPVPAMIRETLARLVGYRHSIATEEADLSG